MSANQQLRDAPSLVSLHRWAALWLLVAAGCGMRTALDEPASTHGAVGPAGGGGAGGSRTGNGGTGATDAGKAAGGAGGSPIGDGATPDSGAPLSCTAVSNADYCAGGDTPEINLGPLDSATCHDRCCAEMGRVGLAAGCWILAHDHNCYCRSGGLHLGGDSAGGSCTSTAIGTGTGGSGSMGATGGGGA